METEETIPNKTELMAWYNSQRPSLERIVSVISDDVRLALENAGIHATIKYRVKSFESLFNKKIKAYIHNTNDAKSHKLLITDVLGIRVICPFIDDIVAVDRVVSKKYAVREREKKGSERTFREFGYESLHLLIDIPEQLAMYAKGLEYVMCEVQIRTLLQDAWAEVEHELVYKAEFNPLDEQMKRKLAALNASLSLSDVIFQEIRNYQRDLGRELKQRREMFYATIEEAIDTPFMNESGESAPDKPLRSEVDFLPHRTIDDLLVMALNAHNAKNYGLAIEIYGRILSLHPRKEIVTVIRKHRGMAFFSNGCYKEAVDDFSMTLSLDPRCHKAAYYRGVVNSVLERYPEALADYELALAIYPLHFFSLYRRGQTYFHLGDYPKALADTEAALALEPENELAKNLKALVLKKLEM